METGSVMTVPASNTAHPLSNTLEKAMETLRNHKQWILNRPNPNSVAPEQLDSTRVPTRDLWMTQDEEFVDKKISHFPIRKLKLEGFKSAAVRGKKIFPSSSISPLHDDEEANKPLHPPKAAITAWDGPSVETELIAIDLEEDTSIIVNSSFQEESSNRRKEEENVVDIGTHDADTGTGVDKDEGKQGDLEGPEQLTEDDKETTLSSETLQDKDNSSVQVEASSNGVISLNDTQEVHTENSVGSYDGHVLAVSPVPRSQQLSLSLVTQSKLRMSELEAFRLENNTAVSAGSQRGPSANGVIAYSVQHDQRCGANKSDVVVPDSVLHVITPQQGKEASTQAAVFTLPKDLTVNISPAASSSVQSSVKEKAVEDASVATVNEGNRRDNVTVDGSTISVAKALNLPELKGEYSIFVCLHTDTHTHTQTNMHTDETVT